MIGLMTIGGIEFYKLGVEYTRQEEPITTKAKEERKPVEQELWKGTMVIYDPIEADEAYGVSLSIRDEREDKTAPWGLFPKEAKHYVEIRIEIDDQVRDFTLNEFRELIFGEELAKEKP